jgi:hypothetical protein
MLHANSRMVSKSVRQREREDRRSTSGVFGGMKRAMSEDSMHHLYKDDTHALVRAGNKSSVSITVVMKGSFSPS